MKLEKLWKYKKRGVKMEEPTQKKLLRVIHKHCLECSGHSIKEVRECQIDDCFLYPFRDMKV